MKRKQLQRWTCSVNQLVALAGCVVVWWVTAVAVYADEGPPQVPFVRWRHVSSKTGQLPMPNGGRQQTACVVFDIDSNGMADIVVGERTQAPALVWLRPTNSGWQKYVIDDTHQRPEAGGTSFDVDGDGDLDLIIGGDSRSNELWWYQNPAPHFDPSRPWKRYFIKRGGGRAHHDQVVADFKGTGRPQLVFWNQGAKRLFLAEIPEKPQQLSQWPFVEIFNYRTLHSRMKQEGVYACDIDADGHVDLLAGQFWFKYQGGNRFLPVQVSDRPGRIAAGYFKPGKYPQIVLAPGDGDGPLLLVECYGNPLKSKNWKGRSLLDRDVISGHTLAVEDINADGNLDIFCAEMHTPGNKDQCTAWILYGDGQGHFRTQVLSIGIGNHDSRVADVNNDGRLDIVTKPYTWDTPRIDIWYNEGAVK